MAGTVRRVGPSGQRAAGEGDDMADAFLEGSIAEAVRERWSRLYAWWGDTGGLVLRHLVLLVFFAGTAVWSLAILARELRRR